MRAYSLPATIRAIVFDSDRTLYDHDEYADEQIESQYRKAAEEWNTSVEVAKARAEAWRADYAAGNNGKHQSLGNTLAALGIPIDKSVRWRSESIHPEEFLQPDRRLVLTLETLSQHVDLIAVTNNPVGVGVATLDVLGVREYLREVVGLESTGFSKPSVEPFQEALRRLGADAEATISVGDRYDVDIAPALAVGMGAIHVAGVEEVHQLPGYLRDSGRLD